MICSKVQLSNEILAPCVASSSGGEGKCFAQKLFLYCSHFFKVVRCFVFSLLSLFSSSLTAQSDSQTLLARIAEYENAIANTSTDNPASQVYSLEGSELFLSLAQLQTQAGDYSAAAEAYQQALLSLRVVEGLASTTQLQLLDGYNAVLFELQRWEDLDSNYHLAYTMSERLFGVDHQQTQTAATRLASWKIRAWQTGVYRPGGDRSVQEASEIYRQLLSSLADDPTTKAQRANWLSARGLAYFYAARHIANLPVTEFQHSVPQTASFQQCIPIVMSVDGAQPSANACHANQNLDPEYHASQQREKNNTVRRHLGNMRQSFMEAIEALEANPETTVEQLARGILNLGDANLLAQDYPRARSQYRRAWELLSADNENLALRQRLLDQPVRALQGLLETLPFDLPLPGEEIQGTVSFDVSEIGEIENINVGGESAALTQENLGAMAIKLDQSVYRPRINEGRPVRSRLSLPASEL